MIVTGLKSSFQKIVTRIRNYRDYQNFGNNNSGDDLTSGLSNIACETKSFEKFFDICHETVNDHAPCKQNFVRSNHISFKNKSLSKEIITRVRLRNRYLKDKTEEN